MILTCRDDSDAKGAGRQSFLGTVGVQAAVQLRPPDQAVDDLAEHAVPSDTHHPERRVNEFLKFLKRHLGAKCL